MNGLLRGLNHYLKVLRDERVFLRREPALEFLQGCGLVCA